MPSIPKKPEHKSARVYIQQVAKPPCMKPKTIRLLNFCFITLFSFPFLLKMNIFSCLQEDFKYLPEEFGCKVTHIFRIDNEKHQIFLILYTLLPQKSSFIGRQEHLRQESIYCNMKTTLLHFVLHQTTTILPHIAQHFAQHPF